MDVRGNFFRIYLTRKSDRGQGTIFAIIMSLLVPDKGMFSILSPKMRHVARRSPTWNRMPWKGPRSCVNVSMLVTIMLDIEIYYCRV